MNLLKTYQVDAFTDRPFSGNPAGVCILDSILDDNQMQKIAAEMNLSETAFLLKEGEGYNLRWFTPTVEVDLCGHATLASAHILWKEGYISDNHEAKFFTKSGLLSASKIEDWIELNFPNEPATMTLPPEGLMEALGIEADFVGKNRFDYIVEVESEKTVRDLRPNNTLLSKVPARGVIVTSVSETSEFDFVSRFFAPGAGIDEDPVTGSAHCCLGPYWMERLGKKEFTAYQASARGGIVKVEVKNNRVLLKGQAVTVLTGAMNF